MRTFRWARRGPLRPRSPAPRRRSRPRGRAPRCRDGRSSGSSQAPAFFEDLVRGGEGIRSRARPGDPRCRSSSPRRRARAPHARAARARAASPRTAAAGGRAACARAGRVASARAPERLDRRQQLVDALVRRWPPSSRSRAASPSCAASESIDSISATTRSTPSRSALFTTKTSAISMMPGLQRLHLVAQAGHQHHQAHVGGAHDLHLVLAHAHRLHEDHVLARRATSTVSDVAGGGGQAAQVAARGHRADEDAVVQRRGACMRMRSPRIAPPV